MPLIAHSQVKEDKKEKEKENQRLRRRRREEDLDESAHLSAGTSHCTAASACLCPISRLRLTLAPDRWDIQAVAHMGYDADKGFSSVGVDPSWQVLLEQLSMKGISPKQIQKNEQFIKDFVAQQGGSRRWARLNLHPYTQSMASWLWQLTFLGDAGRGKEATTTSRAHVPTQARSSTACVARFGIRPISSPHPHTDPLWHIHQRPCRLRLHRSHHLAPVSVPARRRRLPHLPHLAHLELPLPRLLLRLPLLLVDLAHRRPTPSSRRTSGCTTSTSSPLPARLRGPEPEAPDDQPSSPLSRAKESTNSKRSMRANSAYQPSQEDLLPGQLLQVEEQQQQLSQRRRSHPISLVVWRRRWQRGRITWGIAMRRRVRRSGIRSGIRSWIEEWDWD